MRGALPDVPPEGPRGSDHDSLLGLGKMSGLISLHLLVYQNFGISFKMLYCHGETVFFYVINHELWFTDFEVHLYVLV